MVSPSCCTVRFNCHVRLERCYILEKKEVKMAESCLSLKLHLLAGVTCLAARDSVTLLPWFSFNVNLACSEGPVGPQPLPLDFVPALNVCLVTVRSPDQESLGQLFPGVPGEVNQWPWCHLMLVSTFFCRSFGFGGEERRRGQTSGRSVASVWKSLGNCLHSCLYWVSVDKTHCCP